MSVSTNVATATATVTEAKPHFTLRYIDALAAGRSNLIEVVHPTGNKKPGCIAANNYWLYGEVGKPTVTVATFLKIYPEGNGGLTRARASLLWDLQRGFVRIVHPDTAPNADVAEASDAGE